MSRSGRLSEPARRSGPPPNARAEGAPRAPDPPEAARVPVRRRDRAAPWMPRGGRILARDRRTRRRRWYHLRFHGTDRRVGKRGRDAPDARRPVRGVRGRALSIRARARVSGVRDRLRSRPGAGAPGDRDAAPPPVRSARPRTRRRGSGRNPRHDAARLRRWNGSGGRARISSRPATDSSPREAIAASLTRDERREILRGMWSRARPTTA
jgi:hypothetical protein